MRAPKVRRVPVFTHRLRLAWLTSILFFPPCPALAADLTFSGSLERVGHESISIRLADRRLIDARLPSTPLLSPAKIAKQYNFGDQVQITCKPIQQTWEEDTARLQFLELTKLRFVRQSSADELSKMLALPMSREGENLLALPDATRSTAHASAEIPATNTSEDDKLASARKVNLDYAANMPNFVADETAKALRRRHEVTTMARAGHHRNRDHVQGKPRGAGAHPQRWRAMGTAVSGASRL